MKRYFTIIFALLALITVIIGLQFDAIWSGIVSWGLAFIFLIFATYFTKYIPNTKKVRK